MTRPTSLTSAEQSRLHQTAWRLGLQTAALVLVCLLLVGAVVVGVVLRGQTVADEHLLHSTARSIDDAHDAPAGIWVTIDGPHGLDVSEDMPHGLPDLDVMDDVARTGQDRWTRIDIESGRSTAYTTRARGRTVQVVLDPQEGREEIERLVVALLIAGGFGVVLAGLGGAWLGRRAVRPTVEALALQRRFVADASHELRTPLTLLSTRVQLLKRHVRSEPDLSADARLTGDVDGLLEDTGALTSILEDMLLAADARSVDLAPVDITVIAGAAVDAARATAQGRGVELTGPGPAPVVATVSAVSVRRAVTALLDNALDHATGHVRVAVARDGDEVVVQVEDDGPGFPGEPADLFERFASGRTGAARAGDRRHYGLGLALVADVAAQHGGSVTAGPRPDGREGAALTLRLRAAGPTPQR